MTTPTKSLTHTWVPVLAALIHAIIKWGALVMITTGIGHALTTLAGKTTVTTVSVTVGADLFGGLTWPALVKHGVPLLTILVLMGWGWRERRLRQRALVRLQNRIRSMEQVLDPDRSSAALTTTGPEQEAR